MEKKSKKQLYIDIALLTLLIALLSVVYVNRSGLFLGRSYEFTTAAEAIYGQDGRKYVIDEGKTVINVIGRDGVLEKRIIGGRNDRFYYAQSVTEGFSNGKSVLYISDIAYIETDDGTLEQYRVIEYSGGKYRQIYTGDDRIFEIKAADEGLYVLQQDDYGLVLRLVAGEDVSVIRSIYCGDVLNDASADLSTGYIAIATKRGAVRLAAGSGNTWETIGSDAEHLMPQGICAENGWVYFSDFYGGRLCRLKEDDVTSLTTVYREDDLKLNALSVSADGDNVLCCDLISFYEITHAQSGSPKSAYVAKIGYKGFYITVLLWMAIVLSAVILTWLLRFLPAAIVKLTYHESALRMAAVVLAVLSVSSFIAWSLISEQHRKEDVWDVSDMKLVTDLIVNNLDVDLLSRITSESDYASSSYLQLREKLDLLMAETLKEGKDYYYVFYKVEDGKLCYLMNYYDTVMCCEPFGRMNDTYYMDVYNTRRSFALKSTDADGQWLYVLTPVENEAGECVSILEIGTDLSYRTAERRSETLNIILSVFCSSAVMVMLIVEGLFLLGFYERKRELVDLAKADITQLIPLRTIILFSYAAATLQDSFITVLAAKHYHGQLFVPDSVGAGLPLSANLLMMAVFAAVGGHVAEKKGSKMTLLTGVAIEVSGFVICAVFGNYFGLLIGNVFMGIGLGLINVTCNAMAAMAEGTEAVAQAFADVMAGILSGLTVGAGLASLLFPIGGSRLAYSVAACFMLPVFLLCKKSKDVRPDEASGEEDKPRISFPVFFFNRRVLGFLVLILVPFMASISYREYFFPMFAAENGFSEERIGQLYMLCGLLMLYIGPYISNYVIRRFGTFGSIIIGSVAMGLNMLLFVLIPSLITAVLGAFMLSAITSFAYTCQYTYFEELPDSAQYGNGKSMGIYSVFENLGQTIGPMVYGALLLLGYRNGIAIFCILLLFFTGLYIAGIKTDRKRYQ